MPVKLQKKVEKEVVAPVGESAIKRGSVKLSNVPQEHLKCTCPRGCTKKYCVCLKAGVACAKGCDCKDC